MTTKTLSKTDLAQFTGSDNWYQLIWHPLLLLGNSDGAKPSVIGHPTERSWHFAGKTTPESLDKNPNIVPVTCRCTEKKNLQVLLSRPDLTAVTSVGKFDFARFKARQ